MRAAKNSIPIYVLTAAAVVFQMLATAPCATAKHFVERHQAAVVAADSSESNLLRLRKSDSMWTVLELPEVQAQMQKVMGTNIEKYFAATQIIDMPSVRGDELYASGGVGAQYNATESFFDLNLVSKRVCVVVLADRKLSVYGADSFETMPSAAQDFVLDLQSRLAGMDEADRDLLLTCSAMTVDEMPQVLSNKIAALKKVLKNTNLAIQFKKPETSAYTIARAK